MILNSKIVNKKQIIKRKKNVQKFFLLNSKKKGNIFILIDIDLCSFIDIYLKLFGRIKHSLENFE